MFRGFVRGSLPAISPVLHLRRLLEHVCYGVLEARFWWAEH
jgi:hypothetical protein